jgi:fluoroquinolone transport system permease protein
MSLAVLLRTDTRLQLRSGFYAAAAFVAVSYVVLIWLLPRDVRLPVLVPLLLSELTVVPLLFSGTLLHLERNEGVHDALAVTPLTTVRYLVSKALSLSALGAAGALLMAVGVLGLQFAVLRFIGVVLPTAALFVILGLASAPYFTSLYRFAVVGGMCASLLGLAVLPYFGILASPAWLLLPTYPALALIGDALGHTAQVRMPALTGAALLGAWIAGAAWWARRSIDALLRGSD